MINIDKLINVLKQILFPEYFGKISIDDFRKEVLPILSETKIDQLLTKFDSVKEQIFNDLKFYYESDPAATSHEEIILCYPGFFATWVYRIAHILIELDILLIPRMMMEYVHSKTGIDIHPKAIIGNNFFIDHGTGVVIGETSIVGNNVKIYQGVTLGASSLNNGRSLNNKKRHPTIGNNVIIYANATILGKDTIIGDNVIVGGNTFITTSIDHNTIVKNEQPKLILTPINHKKR